MSALAASVMSLVVPSCIINDIPYPRIQANFLSFTAEGQDKGAAIDSINRTITVYLPETVDIQNVTVSEYSLSPNTELVSPDFSKPVDMSKTVLATLHMYQDWIWTIKAEQDIERYFTVNGQVGATLIDVPGKRVLAYVSKSASLSSVQVETIKLGPEGSVMNPDLAGKTVDFSQPVEVEVEAFGRTSLWTLFVERTDVDVSTVSADAWTNVAWVYGQGEANKENGFEYRITGSDEWTRVADEDVVKDGGSFYARIIHLSPLTSY